MRAEGEVIVFDLLPHVGDRLLAVHHLSRADATFGRGIYKAVTIDAIGPKAFPYAHKAAQFSHNRLRRGPNTAECQRVLPLIGGSFVPAPTGIAEGQGGSDLGCARRALQARRWSSLGWPGP